MSAYPLALYLHIPFCRTLCTYCAFNTYAGMDELIPRFVAALITEIRYLAAQQPAQTEIKTIFFGGGTPSLLTPAQYEQIFRALRSDLMIQPHAEISLEANPNDLHDEYLAALHEVGFNRLSIGMQSANEAELRLFQRRHDVAMVEQAVCAARQAGFDNINLDLIYGIPQQTLQDWQHTLTTALALAPQHISLYGLEFKGGTPLTKDLKNGKIPTPDDDLAADMYDMATDQLAQAGLVQYEISNWCQTGYQAQHNLQYWRLQPYVGLGPGAHGYAQKTRTIAIRHPERYMTALENPAPKTYLFPRTPATAKATKVDRADEMADVLMMGLRLTQEGIQRSVFAARFAEDVFDLHRATIERFERLGMLYVDEQVVRLTAKGRLVSNAIIRELI